MTSTRTAPIPAKHAAPRSNDDDLGRLWRSRDRAASRQALATRYMPLARSLARRYERSSEPLDDLVQVAAVGLVKAIDRFDPNRGVAFVSFAVPTVLGELRRYFRDCCWDVHVPRASQERALKLEQAQSQLLGDLGRAPTVAELAQYLELDQEQVLDGLAARQAYDVGSLDAPRVSSSGDDAATYHDLLGEIDGRYELAEDSTVIGAAMRQLSEREQRILALRFGEDLTQSEIAERIGVSQMHVSRLLRRALEQLRILTRAIPAPGVGGDA
jgi:RNA polymerase sigma-B factor